jgi:cystathionine beta-lyase family protein involved in aluminum resistance
MTMLTPNHSTNEIKNQLLIDLRDKMQAASIASPNNGIEASRTTELIDAQKVLAIRNRKSSLNQKSITDIVTLVNAINTSTIPYVKNTLRPDIMDTLDRETIKSLLFIIHNEYTTKIPQHKD